MLLTFKKSMALVALTSVVFLSACSKNSSSNGSGDPYNPTPPTTTPVAGTGLKLTANATFGSTLTDGNGKTLYFFAIDANGTSGCTDGCALAWPSYYAGSDAPAAPAGVNASDIATITRADGKKQTTYKGWPLYYYSGDVKAADATGDGSGGTWFIAKPDYSIMLSNNQLVGANGKNYLVNGTEGSAVTQYLTDAAGRTLYAYAPDTFNLNTFTKPDLSNNAIWPIYESDVLNVPSVLRKDMFVQINSVGKKQLVYKGHPLYYFGSDAKRGDTKGVSVGAPNLVWPVLTVSTTVLTGTASTNTGTDPNTGTGTGTGPYGY